MFGKTDLSKIERLLRQVVANQEQLLNCWEASPVQAVPSAKPVGTVLQKEKKGISVEAAIINYFTSKVSKSASAEALISRMSWWRNYYSKADAEEVKLEGSERQRLVVNGLLSLMESKQLVAKTGIRLGSLTVLFGLSSNIPPQKRISLTTAKTLLRVRFPEDIK